MSPGNLRRGALNFHNCRLSRYMKALNTHTLTHRWTSTIQTTHTFFNLSSAGFQPCVSPYLFSFQVHNSVSNNPETPPVIKGSCFFLSLNLPSSLPHLFLPQFLKLNTFPNSIFSIVRIISQCAGCMWFLVRISWKIRPTVPAVCQVLHEKELEPIELILSLKMCLR